MVCFGTRGIFSWKLSGVKIAQNAAGVFNTRGKDNGGVGGNMGDKYSSSGDFLVQGSTYKFYWLTNTNRHFLRVAAPPGTT
jgi:hypothetical protein